MTQVVTMVKAKRWRLGDLEDEPVGITIGNFCLENLVGSGSMGAVWHARHAEQDVEVALKVILSEQAHKIRFQRAFRQEVRSMAQLNHPFVVDVFDYGMVDDAAEQASIGQLKAGSPFLVMEYAEFGSLSKRLDDRMHWRPVRLVLFSLLDALAHSHARGVLHRDIKPQNVLLTKSGGSPSVKLTDFGLAYALQDVQDVTDWHRAAGTPEYMAPEQVTGKWRQYGPPTDLYAVGCLAYQMLTGRPPFEGDNIVQIANAHLNAPIPDLDDDLDIPSRLGRWIQLMLAKEPRKRFQTAADAAYALRQITGAFGGEELGDHWARLVPGAEVDATIPVDESVQAPIPTYGLDDIIRRCSEAEAASDGWDGRATVGRQIPASWERRKVAMTTPRLRGAGRGLFGLQRLSFFGRHAQRDQLWEHFRECAQSQQVGVSLLSGPAGVGKDYLAEWICDRAGELGVAHVFRGYHESTDESGDELRRMIERKLSLTGLTRPEVKKALKSLLVDLGSEDSYEWDALTEILRPGTESDQMPSVRFASPQQRHRVLATFFKRLSQCGPILVWLNDVHWGVETLNFVRTMVSQPELKVPILFVMTVREDLLIDADVHRSILDDILAQQGAHKLQVEPLDETTIRQLVEDALYLEPSAAYEVARRSGGNPLHAMEVVGQWIERDWLHVGDHGYALRDDASPEDSGDWMQMWSSVVDWLVDGDQDRRQALELGAILGERIQRPVWEHAAQLIGTEVSEELVDTLLERKYVYDTPQGLVFTQNMLREALYASAREHQRWEKMCHACASALDEVHQRQGVGDEKIGLLLVEGGETVKGARRLLAAVNRRYEGCEYHAMIYIAGRGVQCLADSEEEEAKRLRCQLLDKVSHGWHGVGKNDLALQRASEAREIAEELGDPLCMGKAAMRQMAPIYIRGDLRRAREVGMEALEILESHQGAETRQADIFLLLAHIEVRRGNFDKALQSVEKARQILDGVDAPVVRCNVEFVALKARVTRGDEVDPAQVEALLERCRKAKTTLGEAQTSNARAEIARQQGKLDEAQQWYKKAIELHSRIDPDRAMAPRLNRALVAIKKGDVVAGGRIAEQVLQQLRRMPRAQFRLYAIVATIPMHLAHREWSLVADVLDEIEEIFERLSVQTDPDLALCLESALLNLEDPPEQSDLQSRVQALLDIVRPWEQRSAEGI